MSELTLETNARYSDSLDAYAFYSYQIVELTATLSLNANREADNLTVVFDNVGSKPELTLAPYGKEGVDWFPVPGRDDQVQVDMTQVTPSLGRAALKVLVVGRTSVSGSTSASIGSDYASGPVLYRTFGVAAHVTSYPGILAVPQVDQRPSSSGGNYLCYRLQVTTAERDDGIAAYTGLPNMCIRLFAADDEQDSGFLDKVRFFDAYEAPAALNVDADGASLFLDLTTDASGVACLYICAKGGTPACASLTCKAGIVEAEIGPILVVDTSASVTSLGAPYCDDPVVLDRETGATFVANVPQDYVGAAPTDRIFVFCNDRFQSAGTLAQAQFACQLACLRSESPPFDDVTGDELYYVASSAGMVRVSSVFAFDATGTPPPVRLDQVSAENSDPLRAPSIKEAADGWPVNCGTIADGLTIIVPVDDEMELGDQIVIQMALNGFRLASDEPVGMSVPPSEGPAPWPSALVVTSFAREQGSIEWRYQPYLFMGFGQLHSLDSTLGSLGTLTARYLVERSGQGIVYCSELLSIGIDTIPPSGQYELGDAMALTIPCEAA